MPESGPAKVEKPPQLQARAPEATAGSDSEFMPPGAMGILELQGKAGNRAVTAAIREGGLWTSPGGRPMPMLRLMPAVQRWAGNRAATQLRSSARTVQREASGAKDSGAGKPSYEWASKITHRVGKAVRIAHSKFQHVKAQQADQLITLVDAYTRIYPDPTDIRFLFSNFSEDLYELLAPWGFTGRSIKVNAGGRLGEDQAIDSLLKALAKWRAQDAKARKKSRANTKDAFGSWLRDISVAEMAKDDQEVLAGPSRDAPGEKWVDTSQGTRASRRAERQDIKNRHALEQMAAIKNQGPGSFAGMVAGGVISEVFGTDLHSTIEFTMALGSMADPFFMTKANQAEMQGVSGGAPDRYTEASHTSKAPEREPMPTPNRPGGGGGGGTPRKTSPGMGAVGPAGEGAPPRPSGLTDTQLGAGSAGAAGPNARPRARRDTLQGPAVNNGIVGQRPAGGVKTLKAGPVAAVTPQEVIRQFRGDSHTVNHSASDYWHMVQWLDALAESGQWNLLDGPPPPPPLAFRVKGGHIVVNDLQWVKENRSIRLITERSRWGSGGGKSGTQVGVPAGPGGAVAAPGTQVGVAPGPGGNAKGPPRGFQMPKVPSGPPPVPPGNNVRPATHDEARAAHKNDPRRIVIHVDNPEWHQYIWELRNWQDGKRVTSPAPSAFHAGDGWVYVYANKYRDEGGRPEELLPPRPANEFEAAKTLPGGGGGPGSTMGGD